MIDATASDRILAVGEREVELVEPIIDLAEFDDLVVVMLDWMGDGTNGDNVRAYDGQLTQEWTIERGTKKNGRPTPYTSVRNEDGELWCYNWNGFDHRIDLHNGEILDMVLKK